MSCFDFFISNLVLCDIPYTEDLWAVVEIVTFSQEEIQTNSAHVLQWRLYR